MGRGAFSVSFNKLVILSAIPSELLSCDEGKLQIVFVTISFFLHTESNEILIHSPVGGMLYDFLGVFIHHKLNTLLLLQGTVQLVLMNKHLLFIYTATLSTHESFLLQRTICAQEGEGSKLFVYILSAREMKISLKYQLWSLFYPSAVHFLICVKKIFIL